MTTTDTGAEAPFDPTPFLQAFKAEVPQGVEGNRQMRERLAVPFLDTTAEDIRLESLADEQVNSWLDYAAWNLWDFILGRASEGESGLIPRQEYETVSFVQQWNNYPKFIRMLTDEVGVDGLLDLAKTSSREIGTKINVTRNWAASVCPILGRGIGIELEQDTVDSRREDLETIIQFGRRLQHGTWGEGPGFVSAREYQVPVLEPAFLQTLVDQVKPLDDPAKLEAFRQFNARTELFGFMLHYDCRAGMADTGPYPLPGGKFAIVRDHFLNETAYPWAGVAEGLPYCVTEVMVFSADKVNATITEIQTTFSEPSNYLEYLEGAVVFARDTMDTPMSELRVLDDQEMAEISKQCQKGTMSMYRTLSKKSTEEKIRDGVMVYTREFLLPHATRAGIWDKFVAEGFDTMHPKAQEAWPVLTSPRAAEILTPILLFGNGFPHVSSA
ncbi:hypothetical protein GP2_024_00690 [Gordonia paraffinivorans NBRC 108238]|uniref:Uncharacterized protein n=1 Tax=Gordonia paraffinivorans NBRC 108238 TaxID=1223543 RepID=A0ABQ0IM57_9ACTN|nr:hypothetical protein [Gordonia paraffinivorans]GAC84642.1 hypothetical protein GP2_024_00690 [Gordonia paraffinivorans NBRC 108238]